MSLHGLFDETGEQVVDYVKNFGLCNSPCFPETKFNEKPGPRSGGKVAAITSRNKMIDKIVVLFLFIDRFPGDMNSRNI
jgi:hypothetical protein